MVTSKQIAKLVGGDHLGSERKINEIVNFSNDIDKPNILCWLSDKYLSRFESSFKGVLIASYSFDRSLINNENHSIILVENPRAAFRESINIVYPTKDELPKVSLSARVSASAKIGVQCTIGENVVIGENVTIGNNTVILHNTVILDNTLIGDNCTIGCNNTIGGVGFGYEKDEVNGYQLIRHVGNVVICNNVDIGNNTCIDRAVLGSTVIHKNVKIDNLVHIAHGVEVGENSLIIANAMVAGSTKIGKNVWFAPSASCIQGITISDNVTIGLAAVVLKDVEESSIIIGNPGKKLERKK